ncbi:MAG: FG-GAP repeat protein, partial [Ignavibacteria bacterium]|nr:FG-GAP repeat protein [Ignavibacteria bacterium]
MKTFHCTSYFLTLIICVLFISSASQANWQRSESDVNAQQIQQSPNNLRADSNSDSLLKGVTQEWLNDLRDENGNRISNSENSRLPGQIPEDPEGDALQRKIFNGLAAGSNFGYSVSSAGDVNGDGYDDVIIGAYGYNSFTGRAYIYYGGLNMNTVADVI